MEFKYLAIKNWSKFQSAKANSPWVKDYVEKDFDPEFGQLTLSQKGMLDACCRLRARRGSNLTNNPLWICSAVAIRAQERHNAVTAIGQLIDSGFLIPTNQQVNLLEVEVEVDKKVEVEVEKRPQSPTKSSHEFTGDDLVFEVLRQIGISARNQELTIVVSDALNLKAREPTWNIQLAAMHFIERGKAYKASPVWNTQYKTSWLKWFQNQCYDQDPSAWAEKSKNGKQSKLDRTLQNFAELEAEERSQVAGAGHGAAVSGAATPEGKHTGNH